MKVSQLFLLILIFFLFSCINTNKLSSVPESFNEIVNFLQTTNEKEIKQSDDLYLTRISKMRRKKEIIITKLYEICPIIGEILALANVEKIDLIINKFFLIRETDLFQKHLVMWDADSNYTHKSAEVLINLLLCNDKFNRLRSILNLLMEGLCLSDERSLRIFKEVVVTVILDTLLKTDFHYFNELKAKFNLIKIFNKPFHFKPINKIQFIEKMMLSDALKEMLTSLIMSLKSNEEISIQSEMRLHNLPKLLTNNTLLFGFQPKEIKISSEQMQQEMEIQLDKTLGLYQMPKDTLSRVEARRILENIKSYSTSSDSRFKEKMLLENEKKETFYSQVKFINPDHLNFNLKEKLKLSEIKEQMKNDYTDFLLNQTSSSMPNLEEVEPNYQIGLNRRSLFTKYRKHIHNLIILNQLLDQFPLDAPRGSVDVSTPVNTHSETKTTITKEVAPGINVSMQFKQNENKKFRFKSKNLKSRTIKDMNFAEKSLKELIGINTNQDNCDTSQPNSSNGDIKQQIINQSENPKEIKDLLNAKNVKVLFPKEIHSTYQREKRGSKTIEVSQNNPLIDNLVSQKDYNDLVRQQEKTNIVDSSGLFNVVKNIQNRKCSCGFLCIEIGTIHGNFDSLKPKNVTVAYKEKENVHMIIKPILIVNNTQSINTNPSEIQKSNLVKNIDLFENEDCEELKLSPPHFKQINGINYETNIERKFYRKVAIEEQVYSQDTFKQGLNLIIVERDKKYSKIYERTFDTNNNRKESDEMAELLKGSPASKIIIVTGIGKWMGAMTPALIKELKQVGGPDLNSLYSPDTDDNSSVDHAFILIGRRGLCRYNGIFRIKNYDVSKKMSSLFPDLTSDPNDCYFEDTTLENTNNKSEKLFYHNVDLRLTLNINNDNRFAWDAPTISTVTPFRGSIHGGQEIKISGFNLGTATTDIKEVLIHGVVCGDFILLSPNLISCVTRASTILGPGPGNAIVKLRNGYESPKRTCSVFEYVGDTSEALNDLKQTIKTVQQMQDLPVYLNSNYHDQDVSLFDHLKFNQSYYKKNLRQDHTNAVAGQIDTMVHNNYKNIISLVNTQSLVPNSDGLRRRRFKNIITNLQVCDKK